MTAEKFLAELKRLISIQPQPPLLISNSENCELGNFLYYCKNLFACFDDANCADSVYLFDSYMTVSSIDCDYAVESELCYESVDIIKSYNCNYLEYCGNMRDSSFCSNCSNGSNLFGCVNLQNKSFCIFNRQLTESEYREQIKRYQTWPAEKILAYVAHLKKTFPLTQTIGGHNENSDYGNYIHYNKNCYLCFDSANNENSCYLYDSYYCKNTLDTTYSAQGVEVSYEVIDSSRVFNSNYIVFCSDTIDSDYLFNCFDVKNSLGCVNLAHKQYCILNRQYTQEEYEKISAQIKQELYSKNISWADLSF